MIVISPGANPRLSGALARDKNPLLDKRPLSHDAAAWPLGAHAPAGDSTTAFALICGIGNYPASLAPRIPDRLRRMEQRTTALERAFQLARSGRVAGLTDIITSLNREGYSANQIEGRLLK